MHKRILAIVTLLCAIPLLAFATGSIPGPGQQINTWVQSPGGSLQVDAYPAATSTTGSQFLSYSSSTSATNTVYIQPNANYFVNSLILDGVPQSTSSIATLVANGITISATDPAPSVWVSFLRNQLSFTVLTGANYIVFPSGVQPNVYSGATYRVFEFIPAKGQYIASINPSSTASLAYTTVPATLPAAVDQKVIVTVSSITGATTTLSATVAGTAIAPAIPITAATIAQAGRACDACHLAQGLDGSGVQIFSTWSASTHKAALVFCADCHVGANSGAHPGQVNTQFCATCHGGSFTVNATFNQATQNPHGASGATLTGSCVVCHNVARNAGTGFVADNSGVRAITGTAGEFDASTRNNVMGYRSHHIYNGVGVDPVDAQCIACHLEGKASNGQVVVDTTVHMSDAKIHLRDGNTTLNQSQSVNGGFAWDPASPNHTLMDQFCMSCHNAAGAVTGYKNISSAINHASGLTGTPSATNPFGDMLTNAYDQKARPGVVAVYDQFNPTNPSHHAVRAKKYSGRTRNAADPNGRVVASQTPFTQYSGAGLGADIHLLNNGLPATITPAHGSATNYNFPGQPATFVPFAYQVFGTYSTSTAPASGVGPNNYPGSRTTLYDAGFFAATYTTLDGATLGDDSQLHCGDCHSVGQWTNGSAQAITWNNHSTASGGSTVISTTAVIGAHGSQNEYMLRTSNGSDSLQHQSSVGTYPRAYTNGTYVCFLCHTQVLYGDNAKAQTMILGTNVPGNSTSEDEHGGNLYVGGCNSAADSGYGKKGTARYGVITSGTSQPSIGNVFAMSCAHCHNSGQQNFGGIHGATGTYLSYSTSGTDVAGNSAADTAAGTVTNTPGYNINVTQKTSYRFMGGESNRYNGGGTKDKWEVQTASALHREGCYNLSSTPNQSHLWNTATPSYDQTGGTTTYATPTATYGAKAIVNNGNSDSAWGVTDYTTSLNGRYGQNNATSGWGSCNHHQGSTTTGPTAPTRVIQRPLVY